MDISDGNLLWDIRKNVGMVFQNPDNQTVGSVVEEDVAFGPENIGVPSALIRKRVDSSLRMTGLTDMRHKSPAALSGGQKQCLSIAGVLAMQPRCIIFDEATSMLDPGSRREVLRLAHELNKKENITVIWITHFMEEAASADSVYVMDSGRIVLSGEPKAVFSQVEMLTKMGLRVPMATRLAHDLVKQGIPLSRGILDMDDLANEILKIKGKYN